MNSIKDLTLGRRPDGRTLLTAQWVLGHRDGSHRLIPNGDATTFAFEPFRQGSQQGVKHPGVGLGLAIVKKLVELNHGTVSFRNASGAALTVELPSA